MRSLESEQAAATPQSIPLSICEGLAEDKYETCRITVDDHAKMKISTKDAERKLSELTGEEVRMVQEPDWHMMPDDKDVLESWSMAACLQFAKDDWQTEKCMDLVAQVVKNEKTVEEAAQSIGRFTREDPEEVRQTILLSAPTIRDV